MRIPLTGEELFGIAGGGKEYAKRVMGVFSECFL